VPRLARCQRVLFLIHLPAPSLPRVVSLRGFTLWLLDLLIILRCFGPWCWRSATWLILMLRPGALVTFLYGRYANYLGVVLSCDLENEVAMVHVLFVRRFWVRTPYVVLVDP